MTDRPTVLFLCIHNAGRSLAARVLLDHHAHGRVEVRSAGSEPGDQLNPSVVAVLEERGLDPRHGVPQAAHRRHRPGRRRRRHHGLRRHLPRTIRASGTSTGTLDDPAGLPVDEVRPIVDEIDRRVRALLDELVSPDPG